MQKKSKYFLALAHFLPWKNQRKKGVKTPTTTTATTRGQDEPEVFLQHLVDWVDG